MTFICTDIICLFFYAVSVVTLCIFFFVSSPFNPRALSLHSLLLHRFCFVVPSALFCLIDVEQTDWNQKWCSAQLTDCICFKLSSVNTIGNAIKSEKGILLAQWSKDTFTESALSAYCLSDIGNLLLDPPLDGPYCFFEQAECQNPTSFSF